VGEERPPGRVVKPLKYSEKFFRQECGFHIILGTENIEGNWMSSVQKIEEDDLRLALGRNVGKEIFRHVTAWIKDRHSFPLKNELMC
jgi:hypothetical protein